MIAAPDPHDSEAVHAFVDSLYPTFAALRIADCGVHQADAATVSSIIEALRSRAPQRWRDAIAEHQGHRPPSVVPVVAEAPTATGPAGVGNFLESLYPAFARMVKSEGDWLRMDYRTIPAIADALQSRDPHLWQEATDAAIPPLVAAQPPSAAATRDAVVRSRKPAPATRPSAPRRVGRWLLVGIVVVLWCLWAIPAFLDALGLLP